MRLWPHIALAVFVMCLLPSVSEAQPRRFEDMPGMSLDALFDWGGQATGDGYMQGMPWPITELSKRDSGAVVAEALRRLSTAGADEFTHAFNVYLLSRLDPPGIGQQLVALYPNLDERGRYEVLLHALDHPDPLFHPLFTAAIEEAEQSRTWTAAAALGAAFALKVYDPALHRALENISDQTDQLQVTTGSILDGFPYSDVVTRSVSDPLALLGEALAFNRSYADMLERAMTAEEQALLDSYRTRLAGVQSLPVRVEPGGLAKLLQDLSARYDWLNFSAISGPVRFSDVQLRLDEQARSYTEVMAALCNNEGIDFYSDTLAAFSWRVEANQELVDYHVTQRCTASQGYLFRMIPSVFQRGDQFQLSLYFVVYGAVNWLSLNADVEFRFDHLDLDGVAQPLEVNPVARMRRTIHLDLEQQSLEEIGNLRVRGTARLVIPTSMRILEVDVRDQESVEVADGPLVLRYQRTAEEVRFNWGLRESECCSFVEQGRHLPLAIGVVQLLDTSDMPQLDIAWINAGFGERMELGFRLLNLAQNRVFQPGTLRWTYAPTVEVVEVPFEFDQVRFTPKLPQER